jgi:hypothetical protein
VVVLLIVLFSGEEVEKKGPSGCQSAEECGAGQLCAAGGCAVLLPGESAELWRDDIAAQLDAGVAWKPPRAWAEKLLLPLTCPATAGTVDAPQQGQTQVTSSIAIHELGEEWVTVHKQQQIISSIWIDAIRFWITGTDRIDPATICASSEVVRVMPGEATLRGAKTPFVDAALRSAAPASTPAAAMISVRHPHGPPDLDGFHTLDLSLGPVLEKDHKGETIVVLPLGSDLTAIHGPGPTRQRLLTGSISYHWEHGSEPEKTSVLYRIQPRKGERLDLSELSQ